MFKIKKLLYVLFGKQPTNTAIYIPIKKQPGARFNEKAKPEQVAKIMVAAAAEQKRNEQPYYLN